MTEKDLLDIGFELFGVHDDDPYWEMQLQSPFKFNVTKLIGQLKQNTFELYNNGVHYFNKDQLESTVKIFSPKYIGNKPAAYRTIFSLPSSFYPETFRQVMGINIELAEKILDQYVVIGKLEKKYGAMCNTCDRRLDTFNSIEEAPEVITCELCGDEGREFEFLKEEATFMTHYVKIK